MKPKKEKYGFFPAFERWNGSGESRDIRQDHGYNYVVGQKGRGSGYCGYQPEGRPHLNMINFRSVDDAPRTEEAGPRRQVLGQQGSRQVPKYAMRADIAVILCRDDDVLIIPTHQSQCRPDNGEVVGYRL